MSSLKQFHSDFSKRGVFDPWRLMAFGLLLFSVLSLEAAEPKYDSPEFKAAVQNVVAEYLKAQEEAERLAEEKASRPHVVEFVISADDDPVLGDANAPITLIEFSDYQCPYCKKHFKEVSPQIIKNYVDTGKVKIVFRDYPMDFHEQALPAAIAANCARVQGGDKVYYQFHDALFNTQGEFDDSDFLNYAARLKLNTHHFQLCIKDPNVAAEVLADVAEADTYGIEGTPAFFINQTFVGGAYPYSVFEQIIEQQLSQLKID